VVVHWGMQGRGGSEVRRPISKKLRFDIFKRDAFACQYCGRHPPDAVLEIDHISPVSKGGDNDQGNLVTACFDCNRGKAAVHLTVVPKSLAEQAIDVKEREDQLSGYRAVMQAHADRIEEDIWLVAEAINPGSMENGFRRDWLQSIKKFNEYLPLHEVIDAAELALARKPYSQSQRFRYFCGICWNKVKEGRVGGQN